MKPFTWANADAHVNPDVRVGDLRQVLPEAWTMGGNGLFGD
jgi:hypothetical protein